jgi:hypothetical protein
MIYSGFLAAFDQGMQSSFDTLSNINTCAVFFNLYQTTLKTPGNYDSQPARTKSVEPTMLFALYQTV